MKKTFKTNQFEFTYIESNVEKMVLFESHCHSHFEMISVLEGDVNVMLKGVNYRLKENQIIIIPPLIYHTIASNKKGNYKRLTSLFDIDAIPLEIKEKFTEKVSQFNVFSSQNIDNLKMICNANSSVFAPLSHSIMIQAFYDAILSEQIETYRETDEFLKQIINYIDYNLCKNITLDDLANYTSRSKSSVCHLFEEKMNISPKQYIIQKKLALANKLISDGTPPSVASIKVGYDNYSTFWRIYRKHFSSAPSKTKKKI